MSGRVVIVTGASSGIGAAVARAFGRAGDRVVLAARRLDRLQAVAGALPDALAVAADLSQTADIQRVVSAATERFGAVDVLVNNAGVGRYDWLERLTEDDIHEQICVNLTAPILMTRAVLPLMLERRRGVIINISSVAGKIASPTMSIYNATKFGLEGFSESLRREVGPMGVHICVVYPGPTEGTELGRCRSRRPKNVGLAMASGKLRGLRWLRTDTERVAQAVVRVANRPRPSVVVPAIYGVAVAVNSMNPSFVDRLVSRTVKRLRQNVPPDGARNA
jgi:short-subunit dehydrogenase